MRRLQTTFVLALFSLPCLCTATPYYGATFSRIINAHEPPTLHGDQFMLDYDPQRFQWRKFNVYFDLGFSHFYITNVPYHRTLNIYSTSPVIRYTFNKHGPFSPYIEISIGLSYLNQTRLDDRNLGIHFAFQDRMGIGVYVGTKQQISLGFHAGHYSNAHLSSNNSGITMPVVLDLGYRFS